jgi:arylsulfatase A-like enzyme
MAKFGPYEKSTRQAVIAVSSVPGMFPPGKVVDRFVEFVDFAPTFYRLAGIDTGQPDWSYLDGRDLVGETAGTLPPREYVVSEMDPGIGPRAAIRTKDFVFSIRVRPDGGKDDDEFRWALQANPADLEMALFDLRKDPLERRNVASSPRYLQVVENFRQKLQKIVLGDRTEVDWSKEGRNFFRSTWGTGADDKKSPMPLASIPAL